MDDFVIRPGRSLVLWTRENSRGGRFRVATDVAVNVFVESPTGPVHVSPTKLEHEIDVKTAKDMRLTVRVQNSSGTRKARISFEAHG